ncbi:MAG: hypothetical protein ACI8S6_005108 [Myxococcota bacterium]|jgi:hypothetical protein
MRRLTPTPLLLLLLLLSACNGETPTTAPTGDAAPLEGARLSARLSLDLAGTRPSPDALDTEPDVLTAALLDDPRFAAQMRWLWNDSLHTAVWASQYERFGTLSFAEWQAIGAEPLDLIEAVIEADRPFSDIVTAQALPMSETLTALWGLEPGSTGYDDGRPMAGVLTSNTLWLRYTADEVNFNRTRANTVARVFLCSDFLDREGGFRFDVDPTALTEIEAAVSSEPACLGCHAALDPLARFFGGFAERSDNHPLPQYVHYSAYQNQQAAAELGPPAYYGQPAADLADLGTLIAADPRFWRCATSRFYEGLVRTPPTPKQLDRLTPMLRDRGSVKDLVTAIVETDAYRSDEWRLLHSEQLYTSLMDALDWDPGSSLDEGLRGLAWDPELRVMSGGTDDNTVTLRNSRPSVGLITAQTWAGRRAGGALENDTFFNLTNPDSGDEADIRAQLAEWHVRLLSAPVAEDSPTVDALLSLQQDHGWEVALEALIRHPRAVMH